MRAKIKFAMGFVMLIRVFGAEGRSAFAIDYWSVALGKFQIAPKTNKCFTRFLLFRYWEPFYIGNNPLNP